MAYEKGHRGRFPEDVLVWEEGRVKDPWDLRAYCKGCLDYGPTVPLAKLDHVVNIPGADRFEVARIIRDSVGCPMSGPSHAKVIIRWFRQAESIALAA